MDTKAITSAATFCGSQAEFSRRIGTTPQMVWQWLSGRRPVPAKYCLAIEAATDGAVTRHDLRPEVFGPAPEKAAA